MDTAATVGRRAHSIGFVRMMRAVGGGPDSADRLDWAGPATHPVIGRRLRRRLLACGIAASALAVGADLLTGMLSEGYDFTAQSISELSAVGSATRPLRLSLDLTYDALMVAFGAGVLAAAGDSRARRLTAAMIAGNAAVSAVWTLFPMRTGEPPSMANVAFGAVSMVLFVLAIGCGAAGYRGLVRYTSIGILAAYVLLTVLGIARGNAASADGRASVGIQERTMVLGYLLWVALLAVVLLREDRKSRPAG